MFPASLRRTLFTGLLLILLANLTACSGQSDVRGTYEVELRVPRIGVPLKGTLVLGARSLEVGDGAWIVPNTRRGGEIDDEDDLLLDVNSCLVLMSARTGTAHSVMLFEARARTDGIDLPFGFFDSGKERESLVEMLSEDREEAYLRATFESYVASVEVGLEASTAPTVRRSCCARSTRASRPTGTTRSVPSARRRGSVASLSSSRRWRTTRSRRMRSSG